MLQEKKPQNFEKNYHHIAVADSIHMIQTWSQESLSAHDGNAHTFAYGITRAAHS